MENNLLTTKHPRYNPLF